MDFVGSASLPTGRQATMRGSLTPARCWASGATCAWPIAERQPERRAYVFENAGADRRQAQRRLRQLLLQRDHGKGGTTLAALVSRYVAELRHANRAERTVATDTVSLNRALDWFGPEFPIRQVDTRRLEEFRAALVASGRTTRSCAGGAASSRRARNASVSPAGPPRHARRLVVRLRRQG
jgi:hypothetical protein